jgi:hypothetical protein
MTKPREKIIISGKLHQLPKEFINLLDPKFSKLLLKTAYETLVNVNFILTTLNLRIFNKRNFLVIDEQQTQKEIFYKSLENLKFVSTITSPYFQKTHDLGHIGGIIKYHKNYDLQKNFCWSYQLSFLKKIIFEVESIKDFKNKLNTRKKQRMEQSDEEPINFPDLTFGR